MLLGTIEPDLDNASFLLAMGVLGVGMGLVVSQLGNVVQSAVGDDDRSEAGGLQNTAQQLGSSLGTALLGAIVITGLISAFSANVTENSALPPEVKNEVSLNVSSGGSFISSDDVRMEAQDFGVDEDSADALVSDYEDAQLKALKTAFLFAALLVLARRATRRLTRPLRKLPRVLNAKRPPDGGRFRESFVWGWASRPGSRRHRRPDRGGGGHPGAGRHRACRRRRACLPADPAENVRPGFWLVGLSPCSWRSGGASPAGGAGPRGATSSASSCAGPLAGSITNL